MLNHMRELQKQSIPTPDHVEELAKIEQIFNELKPKLECGGARLRCLLDIEKKLREEVAEENFAAGFALGWEIRKELQDAGVLSAHGGEKPGTVHIRRAGISMPKKRANGEGNIRKRKDGRWEGRYTAGYHPETGKRIIKNVLGRTQAETKAKLKKAIEDAQGIDVAHTDDYTVGSWLHSWYDLYAQPNIRTATADKYRLFIEEYVTPKIGHIKLTRLTARDLQKLYKELTEHGRVRPDKQGNYSLSTTTVRSVHLMLHCAFERAVKERLIQRNPTEDCIAPKIQRKEMNILKPEDISAYLTAAEKHDALPMFYLELVSGLRKGELVALRWDDLDPKSRTISVSKQYIRNPNGKVVLSRPKTEASVRRVSIPQETVDLLIQEHDKHPNSPYLFPSSATGEMYYPDSVVNLHKKILKDAGLPHIRFHDLRHTFATLALQNGVDVKTVSSMLGHYDAGFTLRTYTHATRQMQDDAAEKMGSFMAQVM